MILTSKTSNIPWGASNITCTVHAWIWRVFASRFLTRHCAWNMEPVCNCHRFLVCSFKSCGDGHRGFHVERVCSLQSCLPVRSIWKLVVGRLLSFWEVLFSGAMLVLGSVVHLYNVYMFIPVYVVHSFQNMQSPHVFCFCCLLGRIESFISKFSSHQ